MLQVSITAGTAADAISFAFLALAKVAMDIFQWRKTSYLLVIDYYSHFIEIARFTTLTSREVIT